MQHVFLVIAMHSLMCLLGAVPPCSLYHLFSVAQLPKLELQSLISQGFAVGDVILRCAAFVYAAFV